MGADAPTAGHAWVVTVLYGPTPGDLWSFLCGLQASGFCLVVVDNNLSPRPPWPGLASGCWLHNANTGGLAGGFNRGVEAALREGARWITLFDQDSRLDPAHLLRLREVWHRWPEVPTLVGPLVIDLQTGRRHGRVAEVDADYDRTRLLISSGTTFQARDWAVLGPLHTELFIDYVDHAWCFRAQSRGFQLLQDRRVRLCQRFGEPHPNALCRRIGLRLYSPTRHYYSLRNLRWLLLQAAVPLDLKLKEVVKMLLKPWVWLLVDPHRRANLAAIWRGLTDPLPGPAP